MCQSKRQFFLFLIQSFQMRIQDGYLVKQFSCHWGVHPPILEFLGSTPCLLRRSRQWRKQLCSCYPCWRLRLSSKLLTFLAGSFGHLENESVNGSVCLCLYQVNKKSINFKTITEERSYFIPWIRHIFGTQSIQKKWVTVLLARVVCVAEIYWGVLWNTCLNYQWSFMTLLVGRDRQFSGGRSWIIKPQRLAEAFAR